MEHGFICENPPRMDSGNPELLTSLAVLLGNGSLKTSSRIPKIMAYLRSTHSASISELCELGCSPKQSNVIHAAIALGKLLNNRPMQVGEAIANSREIYLRYRSRFFDSKRETFISLSLNSKNCLVQERIVAIGSLSTAVVHPREVMAPLVQEHAAAFIVLHNHPSGNPAPSTEDRESTSRLSRAGKLLGIRMLDHIVLGTDDYFSFADNGLIGEAEA